MKEKKLTKIENSTQSRNWSIQVKWMLSFVAIENGRCDSGRCAVRRRLDKTLSFGKLNEKKSRRSTFFE